MNFNSEEQQLKEILEQINTPKIEQLHDKINHRLIKKSPLRQNRRLTVILATGLCFFLSVNVLAASPRIQELIYLIGSDLVTSLQPINLADENNGFKLEVLGAMNDDEQVVIYLTLKDLIGGRLDATLDVYNYTLKGVSILNMQTIDYNEDTQTATLRLIGNGGENLNGKDIRLGIQSFITQRIEYESVDINLDWNALLAKEVEVITLSDGDSSGGGGLMIKEMETFHVLKPGQLNISVPELDFLTISNVGYIDDILHIQVTWPETNIDDHGYFFFTDGSGQEIEMTNGSVNFGANEENETQYGRNITEYMLKVDPAQLSQLNLKGYFVENVDYVEGDWSIKFKLDSVEESFSQKTSIKAGDSIMTEVSVSPLGITLQVDGPLVKENWNVALINQEGQTISVELKTSWIDQESATLKFISPALIDFETITAIKINNEIISMID
ncbi:MAG: DUF4179 domain-containing protein [Turicibacter sp.]